MSFAASIPSTRTRWTPSKLLKLMGLLLSRWFRSEESSYGVFDPAQKLWVSFQSWQSIAPTFTEALNAQLDALAASDFVRVCSLDQDDVSSHVWVLTKPVEELNQYFFHNQTRPGFTVHFRPIAGKEGSYHAVGNIADKEVTLGVYEVVQLFRANPDCLQGDEHVQIECSDTVTHEPDKQIEMQVVVCLRRGCLIIDLQE